MPATQTQVIEWHYAPLTGSLMQKINGVDQKPKDWSEFHLKMDQFLRFRETGEIALKETVNYGHALFSGHSGRVDVYTNAK